MNWPPSTHQDVQDAVVDLRAGGTVRAPLPSTTFSGVFAESFPRWVTQVAGTALTTGQPRLSLIRLRKDEVVTTLSWFNGGTALSGGTHQWAALCDTSGIVLAISADATNAAWVGSTPKSFTMQTPYTVPADGSFYVALCVAATTPPAPMHATISGQLWQYTFPLISGTAPVNTGTPPIVGANIGTITANSLMFYATVA